jgi:nicotinamide-nucleotide amidase
VTATAARILTAARARGLRIATAESCTGGMLSAALTDLPGSSDVYDRGYITYSNAAKIDMLGVSPETLATYGAVSEGVAVEMAAGALHHSGAGIALSITGIAGPGGSDHKPEGRVCFGLAMRGHATRTETVEFGPLGRENIRQAATSHALALIAAALS